MSFMTVPLILAHPRYLMYREQPPPPQARYRALQGGRPGILNSNFKLTRDSGFKFQKGQDSGFIFQNGLDSGFNFQPFDP